MSGAKRNRYRRDSGGTLIEAALVIPIVLLLIFGLVDFGRYVTWNSTVTNASREGARYAAGTGTGTSGGPRYADCDGIRDAVKALGVAGRPTDGDITIEYDEGPGSAVVLTCSGSTVDPSLLDTGDRILVTVSVPFSTIVPIVGRFIGPTNVTVETIRTINKG